MFIPYLKQMASENISHTPEFVELKFGDAIDKRIATLPKFEGLGAPDLVCKSTFQFFKYYFSFFGNNYDLCYYTST